MARKRSAVRGQVVDLLADHDPDLSDFTRQPWRLWHPGGEPFTAGETTLANSATIPELQAAQRLAMAVHDRYAQQWADMEFARCMIGQYLREEDEPVEVGLARMPEPERSRVAGILAERTDGTPAS